MIKVSQSMNARAFTKFRQAAKISAAAALLSMVPAMACAAPASATSASEGQGGPFESARTSFDPKFKALFLSWKQLDPAQPATIAIPSSKPTTSPQVHFTSSFGVRSDPFKTVKAMHSGIDMAGPIGTPIYATADGIVGRAGIAGGYGNLVELEHGKTIQTRYGHLSAILVHVGQHVNRGDLIARMGSTGRSTGSHLHYEVRVDGRAINAMPFLAAADSVLAAESRGKATQVAMNGGQN